MDNKKRRDSTRTLGDVLKEFVEAYQLDTKLLNAKIIDGWQDIAGKYIAKQTHKIYIKDNVLYVHVFSSVVKNELLMAHDAILEQIEEYIGKKYIVKMIVV